MFPAVRMTTALVVAVTLLLVTPLVGTTRADAVQSYIVLYKALAVPFDAESSVAQAGGTLVYRYDAIGVAIARSDIAYFRENLIKDGRVQDVASTAGFAVKLSDDVQANSAAGPPPGPLPNSPAADTDNLSALQWDMVQIHTPEAHAITGGSPAVIVGDIDTGLDYTHPDLAPNVDFANSVSCVGGVPNTAPAAWNDDNGHGTHTAGTIAAAANGIGIVGVAPNVKIAGIKTGDAAGFFFPEAVVCAFMWAGSHHLNVTNNSYFADPWLFNCRNDPVQRAIWEAERRAIRYAMQQGVTVVAAAGNFADDLTHPTMDVISPDNATPITREIRNNCAVVPVEVPGVVGVTANGNLQLKSFYSSYGMGMVQVIAPGGDSILQRTAAAPNGRVLSTWPSALFLTNGNLQLKSFYSSYGMGMVQVIAPGGDSILQRTAAAPNGRVLSTWPSALFLTTCAAARRVTDPSGATYCYQQGTSMASPHVAGVAALVVSHFGRRMPGQVQAFITQTADPMACPADLSIYSFFPSVSNGAPQVCQGNIGYNSFNGRGQVNALRAVTHAP